MNNIAAVRKAEWPASLAADPPFRINCHRPSPPEMNIYE
jgi:hypothetical protein